MARKRGQTITTFLVSVVLTLGLRNYAKRETLAGNRFRGRIAEDSFALEQSIGDMMSVKFTNAEALSFKGEKCSEEE